MTPESKIDKEIEPRIIRLKMVDGSRINGQVNIKRSPGYDRLSEIVASKEEPFLVIINATVNHNGYENPVKHKTLMVNKRHILWAEPEEDQK
ncbi:MAG: hypothetical protein KKE44_09990 [Proteobacteria bacterium]|nr:hypothetical protein [Pseudomonadota bacterium]MBU1583052.1 hypothetical protein [Pseudomonadota bacterium]MBU2452881.1 hypothetical protein [Pseudomonadota bacterium]MBU2629786.1 hypothetical protein [Pseudomonadota bacterium]